MCPHQKHDSRTVLVRCTDGRAVIVAPARFNAEYLASRLDPAIRQTLSQLLDQPVSCHYVSRHEALTVVDGPGDGNRPSASPSGRRGDRPASPTGEGGRAGGAGDEPDDKVAPLRAADQAPPTPRRRGRPPKVREDRAGSFKSAG